MDWLFAVLAVAVVLLPLVPLFLVGARRRWPFRRYRWYLLSYVFLVSLGLFAALGVKGWVLIVGPLVPTAGAALVFMTYARVLEIGEESRNRHRS
jgi:hypothetical protein